MPAFSEESELVQPEEEPVRPALLAVTPAGACFCTGAVPAAKTQHERQACRGFFQYAPPPRSGQNSGPVNSRPETLA